MLKLARDGADSRNEKWESMRTTSRLLTWPARVFRWGGLAGYRGGSNGGGSGGARTDQEAGQHVGVHRPGDVDPKRPSAADHQTLRRRCPAGVVAVVRRDVRRRWPRSCLHSARTVAQGEPADQPLFGAQRTRLLRGIDVPPAVPLVSGYGHARAQLRSQHLFQEPRSTVAPPRQP